MKIYLNALYMRQPNRHLGTRFNTPLPVKL
ncbi:hypothetical protein LCGC14_3047350, partial [marine sediment metagenome]